MEHAHDFTPSEQALHDSMVKRFGILKAGVRPNEMAAGWLQRMRDDGLLREIQRASLRDVRNYNALKAAEASGAHVQITEPAPPEALSFKKSELRTLDGYRTAVAAGERAHKPVTYE